MTLKPIREKIQKIKTHVLSGGEISRDEAWELLCMEERLDILELLKAAHEITLHFNGKEPRLCSLVNAKSYLCSEDCAFCSQATRYATEAERYPLMKPQEALTFAKKFEQSGIKHFCIVTSGASLSDQEFEQVLETIRLIKKETTLDVDGSLGFVSVDRARKLKEAGLSRFNSNLQTSREFYPHIVSTHTYEDRIKNLQAIAAAGIEICSGALFGMGESREDRLNLAFELKPFQPACFPINILNARAGTPLENQPKEDPWEMVKTVAVIRWIHPKTNLKLAGGREVNLGNEFQKLALEGGANGMIVGGYLTTCGKAISEDLQLLKTCGFNTSQFQTACG